MNTSTTNPVSDSLTPLTGEDAGKFQYRLQKLAGQIRDNIELAHHAANTAGTKEAKQAAIQHKSELREKLKAVVKAFTEANAGEKSPDLVPTNDRTRAGNRLASKPARLEKVRTLADPDYQHKGLSLADYPEHSIAGILVNDEVMQQNIRNWRAASARYECLYHENAGLVNINASRNEIKVRMCETKDLAELRKLNEDAIHLQSAHAQEVASVVRGALLAAYEPVRFAGEMILIRAAKILVDWLEAAKEAEQFFFATYGLPYEETALVRKFEKALKEVRAMNEAQKLSGASNHQWLPDPSNSLPLLGIRDYAD